MDQHNSSHWRQMFERDGRRDVPPVAGSGRPPGGATSGFDDGHDAAQFGLSPQQVTEEAALALAQDADDYRPWILQRGMRPVMLLHLRRYEPRSGLWMGWQVSYPHLVAAEYTGDRLLSLDFGSRQFVIEGTGLGELNRHLQTGSVLMVQEYSSTIWAENVVGSKIDSIIYHNE